MDGLTPRQERFVQEYLVDLNASAAVRRAGYGARVPSRTAARLMAHPGVRAAIAEAKALRAERLQIDAGRVVLELARIAFSDPRELMEWGPDGLRLRPSSEVSRAAAASVAEVHEVKGSVQIKTLDKFKALELLGRHLGMFTADKADAEDNLDVASLLAEARERMTALR